MKLAKISQTVAVTQQHYKLRPKANNSSIAFGMAIVDGASVDNVYTDFLGRKSLFAVAQPETYNRMSANPNWILNTSESIGSLDKRNRTRILDSTIVSAKADKVVYCDHFVYPESIRMAKVRNIRLSSLEKKMEQFDRNLPIIEQLSSENKDHQILTNKKIDEIRKYKDSNRYEYLVLKKIKGEISDDDIVLRQQEQRKLGEVICNLDANCNWKPFYAENLLNDSTESLVAQLENIKNKIKMLKNMSVENILIESNKVGQGAGKELSETKFVFLNLLKKMGNLLKLVK